MAANFQEVAKQFIQFYYDTFDADRNALKALYRSQSMLTFESTSVMGTDSIVEKLAGLPFAKVKHQVTTIDPQPTVENGILILVTGQLLVDEEQRPMNYCQAFQLMQDPATGSYFVFNDVFKLVYG